MTDPAEPESIDLALARFLRVYQRDGAAVAAATTPAADRIRMLHECLRQLPRAYVLRRVAARYGESP